MVYFRSTFPHVSNNINKWKFLYQIGFYSVFCLKHGRDSLGNYYLIYEIYNLNVGIVQSAVGAYLVVSGTPVVTVSPRTLYSVLGVTINGITLAVALAVSVKIIVLIIQFNVSLSQSTGPWRGLTSHNH